MGAEAAQARALAKQRQEQELGATTSFVDATMWIVDVVFARHGFVFPVPNRYAPAEQPDQLPPKPAE